MTEFDAALILDPATSESALAQYPDCASRRAAMEEACRIAVKAIRRGVRDLILDTTKMVPLTPEQLMEMCGKPVYVKFPRTSLKNGIWAIVYSMDVKNKILNLHGNLTYRGYGERVIAYAYLPATTDTNVGGKDIDVPTTEHRIDREAWEPCGECEKKSCDNCQYSEYLSCFEPCRSCENASEWKPMQNFCGECGRPLTEEAWAELEKRLRG